jgi:hypothetical protein
LQPCFCVPVYCHKAGRVVLSASLALIERQRPWGSMSDEEDDDDWGASDSGDDAEPDFGEHDDMVSGVRGRLRGAWAIGL